MLSKKMTELVALHADSIAEKIFEALQTNPRTKYYHIMDAGELMRRIKDVFKNMDRWLIEKSEAEIQEVYINFGKVRYWEGVPLPDLIYAILITKSYLMNFLKKYGFSDSPLHIYQEMELHDLIAQFFEEVIYYTAKGYQDSCDEAMREKEMKTGY